MAAGYVTLPGLGWWRFGGVPGSPVRVFVPGNSRVWFVNPPQQKAAGVLWQILEKRSADQALYDWNCDAFLDADDAVESVTTISADQSGLTFGTPAINMTAVTYADGINVEAGRAFQAQIAGGVPETLYTVHAQIVTAKNALLDVATLLLVRDAVFPNSFDAVGIH